MKLLYNFSSIGPGIVLNYMYCTQTVFLQFICVFSLTKYICTTFISRSVTVLPIKPWPEKMSAMFIVSLPIRCEMKPQKITAKPKHWLVSTWHETQSWLFLLQEIFNFTIFKYWNFSFSILALVEENLIWTTFHGKAMLKGHCHAIW